MEGEVHVSKLLRWGRDVTSICLRNVNVHPNASVTGSAVLYVLCWHPVQVSEHVTFQLLCQRSIAAKHTVVYIPLPFTDPLPCCRHRLCSREAGLVIGIVIAVQLCSCHWGCSSSRTVAVAVVVVVSRGWSVWCTVAVVIASVRTTTTVFIILGPCRVAAATVVAAFETARVDCHAVWRCNGWGRWSRRRWWWCF